MGQSLQKGVKPVRRLTTSEARGEFFETVQSVRLGNEWVILTRHDKDQVAIIPIQDLERLEKALGGSKTGKSESSKKKG